MTAPEEGRSNRRRAWALGVGTLVVLGAVVLLVMRAADDPTPGADTIVLEPVEEATADDLRIAVDVLGRRIESLGADRAQIDVEHGRILVHLGFGLARDEALEAITRRGHLEFREVLAVLDAGGEDGDDVVADRAGRRFRLGPPAFTGEQVTGAEAVHEPETGWLVRIELGDEGREAFAELTGRLAPDGGREGGMVAIALDGIVESAPRVQAPITTGEVVIGGAMTERDARVLSLVLRSGALPFRLRVVEDA